MKIESDCSDIYLRKTRLAYTWTRILNTPFWALYTLLPFIMWHLQATRWQIACFISLKPIASLFSLYWSAPIKRRRDRLVPNIIWASVLGHLPFLLVPFVQHPWFFVFASAIYMLFYRGVNPAWMELLKINIPEEHRKRVFAYGSALYHVGGALLAIAVGWLLDDFFEAWRWLFPLTAVLALGAIIFQATLPIKKQWVEEDPLVFPVFSFKEQFQKPWKEAWELMRRRPDFARFQIGFMLGGGGLMLWQPALPQFFLEVLHLNYKELTIAMTLCKSIGYALALPVWTRAMSRIDIFIFSGFVPAIAALFPLGLIAAQWHLLWLYVAYFLYGIMQAGSEMSWNLSGPIFSKHEDSSTYSSVNVMTVGLRGCIAPSLGGILCNLSSATTVLLMGGGFSLLATWHMYFNRQKEEKLYLLSSESA
jgi:predicted MFS family arabinose efflux permease